MATLLKRELRGALAGKFVEDWIDDDLCLHMGRAHLDRRYFARMARYYRRAIDSAAARGVERPVEWYVCLDDPRFT